ncbi:hypothetical protein FG386_000817 [Cryptosporidium ryanae]|uniref:uncharacterized protein n=1 Tax=Cryptosporidium ryanae TaxID=515981 RepID=UPI00351A0D76|nr:hypothetical protein FG386_000817 [Cryptosporidium ryanae]
MTDNVLFSVLVDPLILLKDSITRNKFEEIVQEGDEFKLEFYNCILSANTPTRCRNRRGESLSFGDLHLFISATKCKRYTLKLAQEKGSKFINILEKKNILEFFEEFTNDNKYREQGIPSDYSLESLNKFECINSSFPLQKCKLLDSNIGKIIHLSFPWVEYKNTESEDLFSKNEANYQNEEYMVDINNLSEQGEDIFLIRQINTISQIYPIGIDYICQGVDMYTRTSSLVSFMNEPYKKDNKKRDYNMNLVISDTDANTSIQNSRNNNYSDLGKSKRQNISTSIPTKHEVVQRPPNIRQSRSTLLAYLNSNNLNPIILVPPSSKSPITMNNIVEFLRDKIYIDPNTIKKTSAGREHAVNLTFGSGPTAQNVTFRILESTLNFRKRDWYSLIAVFLTGAEWQLQSFPFRSIPDIFTMIKGYHITYDSEPIPENIRKWNVDVVRINRTNRHNDLSVWFQFMESIESILASSRDHSKLDRSKL